MAQISKGDTFTNGEQVTGSRLNQLVDSSYLLVGAITEQPNITANTLEATDSTIVNDAGTLKEATIGDILNSNLSITTSSITGGAGVDITVTPAATKKFDVNGAFEADSINSIGALGVGGNATVTGTLAVTGATTLGSASATSLTIGGKTPMTTQDNLTKIYIKSGVASGATGAGVDNIVYQTPTLTIPSDETWIYTFWVQTTSGNVNGSTRPDYGYIQLKVYNNATLLNTLIGSSSPYGGHTATLTYSKSFTSADSSPKLILKTWSLSGLNIEPVYVVMLTKVKTSTLSDSASCI
jgi:hypothetical protein